MLKLNAICLLGLVTLLSGKAHAIHVDEEGRGAESAPLDANSSRSERLRASRIEHMIPLMADSIAHGMNLARASIQHSLESPLNGSGMRPSIPDSLAESSDCTANERDSGIDSYVWPSCSHRTVVITDDQQVRVCETIYPGGSEYRLCLSVLWEKLVRDDAPFTRAQVLKSNTL